MKRWFSLLLISVMLLSIFTAVGEEIEFGSENSTRDNAAWVEYDHHHLSIGHTTKMKGCFFTDRWSSNTSDIDVRHLLEGYNLVTWDGEKSLFRFDHSVVSGAAAMNDADGNRRYLISIYDDLYYSDGTPVTAWDYAFSVLLQSSPVIAQLGGSPAEYSYLLGFEAYSAGETNSLAGLHVLDDRQMIFIVKKEALPYFYELARLGFHPYPIHAIAPGYKVYEGEEGVYIGSKDKPTQSITETLLRKTILQPDTGYLVHPSPNAGPYSIVSFNGETAEFTLNRWYKGNEDGVKPRVEKLTYTLTHNGNMISELGSGKFALLNKVTHGEDILRGMELCAGQDQFTRATYPRTGMTYFYFAPGSEVIQRLSLRKALAYCLDQQQFIHDYAGNFGIEVDGMYGLGQWMYQLAAGTMLPPIEEPENPTAQQQADYEKTLADWEKITLDNLKKYPLDLEASAALLEADGWTLNDRGETFIPGTDKVRYRQAGERLQPLELHIAYADEDRIEQAMTGAFFDHLEAAGVKITGTRLPITELEAMMAGTEPTDFDLIYLGENFSSAYNPVHFFTSGVSEEKDSIPAVQAELRNIAEDMDRTEPQDILGYMRKWIAFQERVSETLPILPVYSNVYFDFYTREIHNYWIADHSTWADAMTDVRVYNPENMTEEEIRELMEDLELISSDEASEGNSFKVKHKTKETLDASEGALAKYPLAVREQIPKAYRTINEFITVSIGEYQNVDSETIEIAFDTKYTPGETVYLLFGAVEDDGVEWIVRKAKAIRNGSVSVTLEAEQLAQLAGKNVPLVVVSKQ